MTPVAKCLFILCGGSGPLQLSVVLFYFRIFLKFLINVFNLSPPPFSSVLATFRTVFWSLFGRGEPDAVELGTYNNKFTGQL